jgi:ribosomal protein S27E
MMLTMHKELSIAMTDLRYLQIHCGHCNTTQITVDLESQHLHVVACPACGQPLDPDVKRDINAFAGVYRDRKNAKDTFSFRVAVES